MLLLMVYPSCIIQLQGNGLAEKFLSSSAWTVSTTRGDYKGMTGLTLVRLVGPCRFMCCLVAAIVGLALNHAIEGIRRYRVNRRKSSAWKLVVETVSHLTRRSNRR